MFELVALTCVWHTLRARLHVDERGEVTEKVILIAIFAALAIAAGAIIAAKVTDKANSILTG